MIETGETAEGAAKPAQRTGQYWHERLAEYRRQIGEKWRSQRTNVDSLYLRVESDRDDREYALFWSNIEVLKPAVYARAPIPVVAPRFKDGNALAREASEVLERSLVVEFERSGIHDTMQEVRDSLLFYSRGTARVVIGENERVDFKWVHPSDFAHEPARTWKEVGWAGVRAWLSLEDGLNRFGEAFHDVKEHRQEKNEVSSLKKYPVWEIWDKATATVYFVSPDSPDLLEAREPWIHLESFWPFPPPAYGPRAPSKLRPIPEVRFYADQIEEINDYTARIAAVAQALRLKGFYINGEEGLSKAVERAISSLSNEATLVPISSHAPLGGASLKDAIVWLPFVEALELVRGLVELRRVVIEDVYQITGISDIIRGSTDPNETLGAQQLKSQWGSVRIRERQNELIRFSRDLTRIAGEIIAENYPEQTLIEMSQSQLPTVQDKAQAQEQMILAQRAGQEPDRAAEKTLKQPAVEEVLQFLKNDRMRSFIIEIETDSTIQPDEDAEKQRRTEFLQAVGGLFQQAAPLVMQAPQLGPFMADVLKFGAAGFRAGRPLEGSIDQLSEMLNQMAEDAMKPKPPPPDPKIEAIKAKTAMDQQKAQMDIESKKVDLAAKQTETQMQMALQQRELEIKQAELTLKERELQLKEREMMIGAQMAEHKAALDLELSGQKHEMAKEMLEEKASADDGNE